MAEKHAEQAHTGMNKVDERLASLVNHPEVRKRIPTGSP